MRESLFNVLEARFDFDGAAVLDLYAGSGALGLESLSRGARSALFVESDRRAAAVISRNITELGLKSALVRCGPVGVVLVGGSQRPADLVFADPPYEISVTEVEADVAALASGGWLADGAIVVLERATAGPAVSWPEGFDVLKERRYGDTRLEMACYRQPS